MGSPGVVYETLSPLFLNDSESPQSYAVYRSEIGSSACAASTAPAAEYFSLDVSTDEVGLLDEEPLEGSHPPQGVAQVAEEEKYTPEGSWFRDCSRFRSPMVQLHKEILDFSEFISPTSEEQTSREAAVRSVFEVIKYIWPHCNVEVFGSFRTGLYLPTSDIDVVILNSKVRTPQMGLSALSRAISQRGIGKRIQVIAKARVPIIKFVERQSGIAFDISFDLQSGPKAVDFIKDAVIKMPALRPLCLILKVFLHQRELNEVFSGGIGSYALIAMLIAHIQIHRRAQNSLSLREQEHNLGVLLVEFFDFYGCKLNNWNVGISCNFAGNFYLKSNRGFLNNDRPYLLSIEDPQDRDNDIGKNSYNYLKVKSAFATAFSSLSDASFLTGLDPTKSILGTIIRPDPILLKRKGGSKFDLNFNSLLPGAGEPRMPFSHNGDISCNWNLAEEEPLPRETSTTLDNGSSPKKRKFLKSSYRVIDKGSKRTKTGNGIINGKEKRVKKQHRKGCRDEQRTPRSAARSPWSF